MTGVTPLAPSFDRVGLFTRTVPEMLVFARMLLEHGGSSGKPPPSVGILTNHPQCAQAAERLRRAGCRVTAIKAFDLSALRRAMLLQIEVEAAPMLLPLPSLSEPLRRALEFGRDATPERLERAESTTTAARRTIREWLKNDLLLLPSTPQTAFPFDGPVPVDQADYATLSSLLGLPAISVPAPVAPGALPIGVQLVAPAGKDASLLTTAALIA
jgi:Asp-tRNA(Asn)/Glu-tRNA(Gln) amidotransferase A subunit family amidase